MEGEIERSPRGREEANNREKAREAYCPQAYLLK